MIFFIEVSKVQPNSEPIGDPGGADGTIIASKSSGVSIKD
tara:strand:+ start:370 stop:489 length:120 start_codon:yes stop_codon:yes gene_type:complete